jgi:hypothetical protein
LNAVLWKTDPTDPLKYQANIIIPSVVDETVLSPKNISGINEKGNIFVGNTKDKSAFISVNDQIFSLPEIAKKFGFELSALDENTKISLTEQVHSQGETEKKLLVISLSIPANELGKTGKTEILRLDPEALEKISQ